MSLVQKAEDPDPSGFTERLLRQLFPQMAFFPFFAVERAHRMPAARGPLGAPPRTFILRLLNYRDRDAVLRESRKMEALRFEGSHLMIFPDFSVETQKQRKSFDHVKQALRQRGFKYSMLFPARLRVQDGETH